MTNECPTCKGDGAVYEQVRVGQSATPFVCPQCGGDGEARAAEPTSTVAEVRRIFSAHALKSDRERLSSEFDQLIRDVRATAWDEGASDGQWNLEHEGAIERGTREPITNPYRENGDNND